MNFKNFFGVFKQNYEPEPGETVLKTFDAVWTNLGAMRPDEKVILIVTDKKFLISYNSLGGYPGYGFFFDKSMKKGFFDDFSVIQSISKEKDSIIVNSKGYFKYLKITDKERVEEIFELISKGINSRNS